MILPEAKVAKAPSELRGFSDVGATVSSTLLAATSKGF